MQKCWNMLLVSTCVQITVHRLHSNNYSSFCLCNGIAVMLQIVPNFLQKQLQGLLYFAGLCATNRNKGLS